MKANFSYEIGRSDPTNIVAITVDTSPATMVITSSIKINILLDNYSTVL